MNKAMKNIRMKLKFIKMIKFEYKLYKKYKNQVLYPK